MLVDLFLLLSPNDLHFSKLLKLNPHLEEKLTFCVDVIKARLTKGNLNDTSNGLHSYLFDLRLDVIRAIESTKGLQELLLNEENNIPYAIREINKGIDDLVIEKEKAPLTTSNSVLVSVLKDYQSISALVLEKIAKNPSVFIPIDTSKLQISYEALKYIETLAPSFSNVRKMIDASLNLEFGLLVCDLLADNEIIVKKDDIEQEVLPFIKNALSEYGTYAILANLWIPTNAQLDQPFFNRMKIKASIINCESGNTIALSMDQLKQLAAS